MIDILDRKEAGFTLIETLITLLLTSLLIFMPILSIDKITESIQIDLFFRELSSTITMMQNHAILTGDRTTVEFIPGNNLIKFKVYNADYNSNHPLNSEIYLEEGLYEIYGNGYNRVTFHGYTGNIAVFDQKWTTNFNTSKGLYRVVFQLGSGRFDIRKK